MIQHISVKCDVSDCDEHGDYWIDVRGFEDEFICAEVGTFRLCIHHQYELDSKDDDGGFMVRLMANGSIQKFEIGGYSCSDDCPVCN